MNLGERTKSYALRVIIPKEEIPNRGFKECCYSNIVLADTSSLDDEKNDYYGVFHQRSNNFETCEFVLYGPSGFEELLNDQTFGEYKGFGTITDNDDMSTFIVEWRKVLIINGAGTYYIQKNVSIGGLSYSKVYNSVELKQYSVRLADHTIRIDWTQNGKLTHYNNANFKNSLFRSSLRLKGFFGRQEPRYVQENDVYRNEKVVQNNMYLDYDYVFQANKLPECITEELFPFALMGNDIYLNDYNGNNHTYKVKKLPVVFKDNTGSKFSIGSRMVQVNLIFERRFKDMRKINL